METTKTLKEEIVQRLDRSDNKLALATTIIENAKRGDKSSLNLIGTLLDEKHKSDEEKLFPLTDAQFEEVILLYADRVRSSSRID